MFGLYLNTGNVCPPDRLKVVIQVPGNCAGGAESTAEIGYEIAVLKNKAYTIDEIIQKRLYFLIPFFIFNYDHLERYEADAGLLAEMCGGFEEKKR